MNKIKIKIQFTEDKDCAFSRDVNQLLEQELKEKRPKKVPIKK
jgi:hypothetical protein